MVGIRTAMNILLYSFNIFQFLFFTFYLTFCSVPITKWKFWEKTYFFFNEKNSKKIYKKNNRFFKI